MNSMQIDGADGSPVLYPYVTEYLGDVTTNIGRTEFIFDLGSPVSDNIALIYGPNTASFIRQSNSWQRGNLTKKSVFSTSNQLLSETINAYTILHEANLPAGMLLHEDDLLTCTTTGCVQFLGKNHYSYNYYTVKSGASKPGSTTETIYDPSDQTKSSSVNTSNLYDDNYLQPLQVTRETGPSEQVENYFKYPFSYSFTGTPSGANADGIKYLQDKNISSATIEQYNVRKFLSGTPAARVMGGVLNTYVSGTPYPAKVWQLEPTTPLLQSAFGTGSSVVSNAISIPTVYQPKISFVYDGYGNISEYQQENDISNSFIWGYNRANIVAKVVGASYSSIMATPGLNQTILQNPSSDNALGIELNKIRSAFPAALVTTYVHKPLIGVSNETDPAGKTTFYEYDSFNRLKNIKDYQGNIVKNYQYNYANSCGSNCVVLPMQNLNGSNTIGYPVGVFNVNGQLLGNASSQIDYKNIWNLNPANQAKGVLAAGTDALHFNLTLATGQTAPTAVIGLRYYQMDLNYTEIDAVQPLNCAYVDFGDGTSLNTQTGSPLPANTTMYGPSTPNGQYILPTTWYKHTYPNNNVKILTFYHNDASENPVLFNYSNPGTSLTKLSNLRGNFPQFMTRLGGAGFASAGLNSVANITNWSSISTVKEFIPYNGEGQNPCTNMNYGQDFMAGNKNLKYIHTDVFGAYRIGYRDLNFKISRLKSDWNSYFTDLEILAINEDHWNHEDLSGLKKLWVFALTPATTDHAGTPNSGVIALGSTVIDNAINQIWNGAGMAGVKNGAIFFITGGSTRSPASDIAYAQLRSAGWVLWYDGNPQN